MKTFPLTILTQDGSLYGGLVESVVVPAGLGKMGILADHAPFLSTLTAGQIIVHEQGNPLARSIPCDGYGFIEVSHQGVTVLLHQAVTGVTLPQNSNTPLH